MTALRTILALAVLCGVTVLDAPDVHARPIRGVLQKFKAGLDNRRARMVARARASQIRTGIQVHKSLIHSGAAVNMPQSEILSNKVAAKKVYGDSWSCRESSRLLSTSLVHRKVKMTLDSSGKNAFKWGNEGWVDYHYYLVDNASRPTVLLDPTASSNFARDARSGGLMYNFLMEAGRSLGQNKAASRLARRIHRGGIGGLLVIANQPEIAVYKDALERAARLKAQVTRNAERNP